jgi:hypothetical protein
LLGLVPQHRQLAGPPRIGHHDVDVRKILRQAPDGLLVGDIQLDWEDSVAVVVDGVREGVNTPGGSVNALGTTSQQRLHEVTANPRFAPVTSACAPRNCMATPKRGA